MLLQALRGRHDLPGLSSRTTTGFEVALGRTVGLLARSRGWWHVIWRRTFWPTDGDDGASDTRTLLGIRIDKRTLPFEHVTRTVSGVRSHLSGSFSAPTWKQVKDACQADVEKFCSDILPGRVLSRSA